MIWAVLTFPNTLISSDQAVIITHVNTHITLLNDGVERLIFLIKQKRQKKDEHEMTPWIIEMIYVSSNLAWRLHAYIFMRVRIGRRLTETLLTSLHSLLPMPWVYSTQTARETGEKTQSYKRGGNKEQLKMHKVHVTCETKLKKHCRTFAPSSKLTQL